jgi:two-component system sensor histidine kinase AlgZ
VTIDRRRVPRADDSWLPSFCSPGVVVWTLILAELILLFVCFAPTGAWPPSLATVALGTLFVQWLSICNLALLCAMRPRLSRMPTPPVTLIALASVAAVSTSGSLVAFWFHGLLGIPELAPTARAWPFALSVAAMATLVAAAALRYCFVAAQWRKGVAAGARAQFDALQARIRPHFLFNSMNTIAALIRTRPADAERAVEDLSDLFRAALRDDSRLTTLAEELAIAARYLAIEQLRLGDRLQVRLDAVDPPPMEVPPLLLQPLVENAVLHGIQPLRDGGTVELTLVTSDHEVLISIRNPRPRSPTPSRGTGTALDNVRRRLDFHFAGRARMEVDVGDDYYAVRLALPLP